MPRLRETSSHRESREEKAPFLLRRLPHGMVE